jgi:hypothetical protein
MQTVLRMTLYSSSHFYFQSVLHQGLKVISVSWSMESTEILECPIYQRWHSLHVYASMSDSGSGMGHVHWSGVPIRHGSLDGRPHTIHARWHPNDPRFDPVIADIISNSRWVMIFKLNNTLADPKRGMENYDPCEKYDYIYKVMVHNMNYGTK